MLINKMIPNSFKDRISANILARSSKRLDICATQFATWFHLSNSFGNRCDLKDKTCLEVGSGWVLSHALICYLLGAKHVFATDISPHAHPSMLKAAVHCAIPSIVRDTLAPFCNHEEIGERLEQLLAIKNYTFKALDSIGIEYIAPVDLAQDSLDVKVDFIYSNSVLEHIPVDDIHNVLNAMALILNSSGYMIHAIHLEDHSFIKERPFDFFSESTENYSPDVQSQRGNRVLKSQWLKHIQMINGLESEILYEYHKNNVNMPDVIDPSIKYVDESDLRVSHLGLLLSKSI